ncbi:hypothetical protein [Clostridium perfringens]|uniref:hypothetical protein n=1 Tax=Clostridium perfringens TaxID=1502 RepID=UPI0018E49FEC|nr:hypothetical protein [Clostridium perfringens]MBI5997481.1 hypothetical protein [Clostridium perfringens]
MLSFLTLIKLLIHNVNLLIFFITMFLVFGKITKDYKSSLIVMLEIAIALNLVHLI